MRRQSGGTARRTLRESGIRGGFEVVDEQEKRSRARSVGEPLVDPLVRSFRTAVGLLPDELAVHRVGEIHDWIPVEYGFRDRPQLVGPLLRPGDAAEIGLALDVLPGLVEPLESTTEPELLAYPSVVGDGDGLVASLREWFGHRGWVVVEALVPGVRAVFRWIGSGEQRGMGGERLGGRCIRAGVESYLNPNQSFN